MARKSEQSDGAAVIEAIGRARYAVAGMFAIAGAHVTQIALLLWTRGMLVRAFAGEVIAPESWAPVGQVANVLNVAQAVLLLAGAVVFLRWLHKLTAVARRVGEKPFRWTPSKVVWGFFVPLANVVRPYRALRDLHDSFAFEALPRPAARVVEGGYRDAEVVEPPPPPKLPRAFIAAWWATYLGGSIVGVFTNRVGTEDLETLIGRCNVSIAYNAIEIVGALLAVRVVKAVTARLTERWRRMSFPKRNDQGSQV